MRIPRTVGQGPAGTTCDSIPGGPGVWEEWMIRTDPTFQCEPDVEDSSDFTGIYFLGLVLLLFFGLLILRHGRSIKQILEMPADPDAPWQATAELFLDDAPSTSRAYPSSGWEEDTRTLCGEEEAEDTHTLCGEDGEPGQAGMDLEKFPEPSSSVRAYGRRRSSSSEDLTSFWA